MSYIAIVINNFYSVKETILNEFGLKFQFIFIALVHDTSWNTSNLELARSEDDREVLGIFLNVRELAQNFPSLPTRIESGTLRIQVQSEPVTCFVNYLLIELLISKITDERGA